MNQPQPFRQRETSVAYSNANFMSSVYLWMMLGLAVSGIVAYAVGSNPMRVAHVFGNNIMWIGLIVLQFAAVIWLTAKLDTMSISLAISLYLGYAILSGITLSVIFLVFTTNSIYAAFFITAFAFSGLSIFGYFTKMDLGPIGTFCIYGLFGLIGFWLVAMFFPAIMTNAVSMAINVISILVFSGLTAYDTQKIKNYNPMSASVDLTRKKAIHGALLLYLDFINLFLSILRLTGDRR